MADVIAETLGTDLAGRFKFIGEIGRGGMANVYLTATRGALGGFQKLVVIKLLRADLAEEQEFRQMFLAEARLAARLNHPGVVGLYELDHDEHSTYLVSELVRGRTFAELAHAGALSDSDVARIGLALCDALDHAHELPLGMLELQVKAPERARHRPRMVVLDEHAVDSVLPVALGVIGLDEKPTAIGVDFGFDDEHIRDVGRRHPHVRSRARGGAGGTAHRCSSPCPAQDGSDRLP